MSTDTWRNCWGMLEATYPNAKQIGNPESCGLYAMVLGAYMDHEVRRAVKQAIMASKFFPAPAELLERISKHRMGLGHDWETVQAKLELEAAGKPVPAIVQGKDHGLEIVKGLPGFNRIGTAPKESA